MIFYWLLFSTSAYNALTKPLERWSVLKSLFIVLSLSIIIGFRYKVGEDWANYLKVFRRLKTQNLLDSKEFLFVLIGKLSHYLDYGIYGVNFICGLIFSTGLVVYCKSLKRPWLALTISIPYIVIVIGMGYTRQSAALGILMIGYTFLSKGKKFQYIFSVIFASLFHLSSFIGLFFVIPFVWDAKKRFSNKIIIALLSAAFGFFIFYLNKRFIEFYILVYLELEVFSSTGVYIRIFMISFPSLLFLILGRNLQMNLYENLFGRWISYYSLILLGLLLILPSGSNAVVDRLALYALPFLTFVLSNLPELKFVKLDKKYMNIAVVGMSFLIQYVWFTFSFYSRSWIPYQNIIFMN